MSAFDPKRTLAQTQTDPLPVRQCRLIRCLDPSLGACNAAARVHFAHGRCCGVAACGRAQQPALPVFGILLVFSQGSGRTFTEPLRAYMQALGYFEGRNITFDVRYADGKADRLPHLQRTRCAAAAVIATFGDATGLAVKAATTTIPVVSMSEDLVRAKLVTRMRIPSGNITGVSVMGTELDAKRLEILAELLPARSTVLLLQIRPHIASPDRRSMRPRRGSGSPFAKRLLARQTNRAGVARGQRTAVRPASTCCLRRCCLRCEGTSSASQRNWSACNVSMARNGGRRRSDRVWS